jgi:lysophospholipid acyltransferase (LPLAT)-like uncharacterized protein
MGAAGDGHGEGAESAEAAAGALGSEAAGGAVRSEAAGGAVESEAAGGVTEGEAAAEPRGWRVAALSLAAAWTIRGLRATVRLRHHGDAELRARERRGERLILAFWHRHLLLAPYAYRGRRISVLISRSRDGELIARTVARFGIDAARGSSSRGGVAGLRELLRKGAAGYDLAFTPDGPRGPAGRVQPGVVLAAAATGFPVFPLAIAASRARRLRSWDRFLVALPFATVHVVYGEALTVPRRAAPEAAGEELRRRLEDAEVAAERLARGERRGDV